MRRELGPQVMDSTWSVLCFLSMIALTSRAEASSVGASGDGQHMVCALLSFNGLR